MELEPKQSTSDEDIKGVIASPFYSTATQYERAERYIPTRNGLLTWVWVVGWVRPDNSGRARPLRPWLAIPCWHRCRMIRFHAYSEMNRLFASLSMIVFETIVLLPSLGYLYGYMLLLWHKCNSMRHRDFIYTFSLHLDAIWVTCCL
jgi:hypothetical protein